MKVRVRCPDGHEFRCDQAHLGRKVVCAVPGCGAKFRLASIEDEQIESDWLELVARTCPACAARADDAATLCTACGTDLRTGKPFAIPAAEPSEPWSPAPITAPPDPRADYYRRLEVFTNISGGMLVIIAAVFVAALAVYLAMNVHVDVENFRWRLRLIFLFGWAPTWWIVFGLASLVAISATIQLLTTGKVDMSDADDD